MKFKTACLAASLAAAGLATTGIAQAQSKVELYGIVDVNVETFNNAPDGSGGSHSVTGMRSGGQNGSRWGLRGTEDLGNGLRAVFALENGFNLSNGSQQQGSGTMFGRQAWVGLQGDWGTIGFGKQYTPSHSAIVANTPNNFPSQYEPVPYISPVRGDNMIRYQGTFSGFTVGAYYAFSNQTAQMLANQDVTGRWGGLVGYNYQNQFRAMVGYDRVEDGTFAGNIAPANYSGKADNWLFGARADFGQFRITGGYRHRVWRMSGQSDIKSNMFMAGVGYQHTPGTGIGLGYFYDKLSGTPAGVYTNNAVRTSDKWQQLNLFGTYALSRRTNFYLTVGHSIDGALNLGFGGDGGNYALASGKSNQTGAAIGIRHMF